MTYLGVFVAFFLLGFLLSAAPPLITDFYRHGWDNHLCPRECCRFDS